MPGMPLSFTRHPTKRRWARASVLTLLGITAIYNYFWKLGTRTEFTDEVTYVHAGQSYLRGDFHPNHQHPLVGKYLLGIGDAVFGTGPFRDRIIVALLGLLISAVLFFFARHVAGFWAGLLAAALWVLVPRPVKSTGFVLMSERIDRYDLLDVPAALFAIVALYLAWRWTETRRRAPMLMSGLSLGLATGSKLSGALVAPAILALAVVSLPKDRRLLGQLITFIAISTATFLATYLPLGLVHGSTAVGQVVGDQLGHAASGHPVLLSGTVYRWAPIWAHAWYQWEADGALTFALLAGALAAGFLLPRRLVAYLAGAVLVPFVVLSLSPVALPHYREVWLPPLYLLVALGVYGLLTAPRVAARGIGIAVLIPLVISGIASSVHLASARPTDYHRMSILLSRSGYSDVTITGGWGLVVNWYMPGARFVNASPPSSRLSPMVVILDPVRTRRHPLQTRMWIADARRRGLRCVEVDRLVLYVDPRLRILARSPRLGSTTPATPCGLSRTTNVSGPVGGGRL